MLYKKLEWADFKSFFTGRILALQYLEDSWFYYLYAMDGSLNVECQLDKYPSDSTDLDDFVNNYKAGANKSPKQSTSVASTPAFGAKTFLYNGAIKNLFARFTGQQYTVNNGANTLTFTATYPWAKIIGVEVINCSALDTADLKIYDTAAGTYSGVPNLMLNQFSYALNLPKDYYLKTAQFDADLYVGMVIKVTYTSVDLLPKNVGINFLMNEVKS